MRWRSKPFHRWECVSQRFVVPLNFLQKIMNHEISSSEAPEKQGTHNPWRNQVMYRRCVSNRLAYPQNKGCLKRKSRGNQSRKPRGPMWNPQPKIIQTGGRGYSWGNRTRMTGTNRDIFHQILSHMQEDKLILLISSTNADSGVGRCCSLPS